MGKIVTSSYRRVSDHFEPDLVEDPAEQRKRRGHLEQIDYTVFAANQAVMSKTIHSVGIEDFQNLALSASKARSAWVDAAMSAARSRSPLTEEEVKRLTLLRAAYEELSEAYEATRRMVERGYLQFKPPVSKTG
ncbi:hypothetical protein [Maricaulis alexandrii]|jgi:hypothetical protein|uniref:hypothetical protein n=1 Tax=Maricaulis alexandrii TaxID=2570354 RepID=UPI001108E78E|nr:hypothetical protein [Maricaulis alexandrii]